MEPANLDRTVFPKPRHWSENSTSPAGDRRRPFALRSLVPYGYISPTMLLIFVLLVIPIAMVVSYSFQDNVIVVKNPVFAGLANYTEVLTDPVFLTAIKNTFIFITLSTIAHLVLGLAFAMMSNRFVGWIDQSHLPHRLHPAVAVHDCGRGSHLATHAGPIRCGQLHPDDPRHPGD